MRQHLLPLSIAASVIALLTYAGCVSFIPTFLKQSLPDESLLKPGRPHDTGIPPGLGETIASREYHISYDRARQVLQSPNRKHNIRASYKPGNLTVRNRVDSPDQHFLLELKNEGILADGLLSDQPTPAAEPEILENRLLIRHATFTEEFINSESGLRQNFIIQHAPADTKELEVKLSARGLRMENGSENELLFFAHNDQTHPRLIYRDLKCWDAGNRPLTAHLTGEGQQIRITVDVYHAAYPVTIDPIVVNGNPANANALFASSQADALLGFSVASAGDINSDGYSDVLAGAPHYDNGEDNEGAAFLYYGSANGLNPAPTLLESNQAHAEMGYSVSSAGDINNDGFSDIALGAPFYDNGQPNEGIVFVHFGSPKGIKPNPAIMLEGNQFGAQFGKAVALAGDVNNDSYSDLIVGASEFDKGQLNEGAAFVYYGSKVGINPNKMAILEMNQSISGMGASVAGAGDVNSDGFSDVLVGAPFYDQGESNEGAAFAYLGNAQGISLVPTIIQSDQADAHLGTSLASAGDLNGDGYGDIIVGAWSASLGEQNEGAAYIFHGTSAGLDFQSQKILESNQANAKFGASVACAGDVNGDGFSDVIVGGNLLDHPEVNEGVAVVYYGTANGISIAAPAAPTFLEINTIGAYFGSSVSSAGDVNGDGYSDVIVGAYNFANNQNGAGKAFVFHGSPSGTKTASSFSIEGEETTAYLGRSVSGAGDVNGDGYSDVLVGVPGYNNGQYADAGKVSLFYGNNGIGLRSNVRLYNNDVSTPINHNNFNMPDFGVGLFAKSFLGVNEGKLVIETKGTGIPFSKVGPNPITNSTLYTSIFPTSDNLSATGTELQWVTAKQGISTKLRVRVRYSPVLALTGQMYGPWRYLQSQLAGYNNAPVPEEAMAETIKRKADAGMESQGISIVPYPNPVSDKLFIKAENMEHIHSVRLLTATGKLIHQSQNAAAPIDVRSLAPGMYVLLITRQDGSQSSHKVIVKK